MMEKQEADIQYHQTALARIELEMKENVHAYLEQAKRDIMKKCEERIWSCLGWLLQVRFKRSRPYRALKTLNKGMRIEDFTVISIG